MTETGFLETLSRLETADGIIQRLGGIDTVFHKVESVERFVVRFGSIEELANRIEAIEQQLFSTKDVLSINEAAEYLDLKKSYLYKMTSTHEIPVYKPNGKHIYIERSDLDAWKRRNPVLSRQEAGRRAALSAMADENAQKKSSGKGGRKQ